MMDYYRSSMYDDSMASLDKRYWDRRNDYYLNRLLYDDTPSIVLRNRYLEDDITIQALPNLYHVTYYHPWTSTMPGEMYRSRPSYFSNYSNAYCNYSSGLGRSMENLADSEYYKYSHVKDSLPYNSSLSKYSSYLSRLNPEYYKPYDYKSREYRYLHEGSQIHTKRELEMERIAKDSATKKWFTKRSDTSKDYYSKYLKKFECNESVTLKDHNQVLTTSKSETEENWEEEEELETDTFVEIINKELKSLKENDNKISQNSDEFKIDEVKENKLTKMKASKDDERVQDKKMEEIQSYQTNESLINEQNTFPTQESTINTFAEETRVEYEVKEPTIMPEKTNELCNNKDSLEEEEESNLMTYSKDESNLMTYSKDESNLMTYSKDELNVEKLSHDKYTNEDTLEDNNNKKESNLKSLLGEKESNLKSSLGEEESNLKSRLQEKSTVDEFSHDKYNNENTVEDSNWEEKSNLMTSLDEEKSNVEESSDGKYTNENTVEDNNCEEESSLKSSIGEEKSNVDELFPGKYTNEDSVEDNIYEKESNLKSSLDEDESNLMSSLEEKSKYDIVSHDKIINEDSVEYSNNEEEFKEYSGDGHIVMEPYLEEISCQSQLENEKENEGSLQREEWNQENDKEINREMSKDIVNTKETEALEDSDEIEDERKELKIEKEDSFSTQGNDEEEEISATSSEYEESTDEEKENEERNNEKKDSGAIITVIENTGQVLVEERDIGNNESIAIEHKIEEIEIEQSL